MTKISELITILAQELTLHGDLDVDLDYEAEDGDPRGVVVTTYPDNDGGYVLLSYGTAAQDEEDAPSVPEVALSTTVVDPGFIAAFFGGEHIERTHIDPVDVRVHDMVTVKWFNSHLGETMERSGQVIGISGSMKNEVDFLTLRTATDIHFTIYAGNVKRIELCTAVR